MSYQKSINIICFFSLGSVPTSYGNCCSDCSARGKETTGYIRISKINNQNNPQGFTPIQGIIPTVNNKCINNTEENLYNTEENLYNTEEKPHNIEEKPHNIEENIITARIGENIKNDNNDIRLDENINSNNYKFEDNTIKKDLGNIGDRKYKKIKIKISPKCRFTNKVNTGPGSITTNKIEEKKVNNVQKEANLGLNNNSNNDKKGERIPDFNIIKNDELNEKHQKPELENNDNKTQQTAKKIKIIIKCKDIEIENVNNCTKIKYKNDSINKINDDFISKTTFYKIDKNAYDNIKNDNVNIELCEDKTTNHFLVAAIKNIENNEPQYYILYCENANTSDKNGIFDSTNNSEIIILKNGELDSIRNIFYKCQNLTSVKLTNLNLKNTKNMSHMFYSCTNLSSVDLSNLDCSNITDMSGLFNDCKNLKNINFSNFTTDNVKTINGMFYRCSSLRKLDLSNLNTQNVTNMSNMFYGCSSLEELDLSNLNTQNVANMSNMFYGCSSLQELDLSHFNTRSVTNISNMFYGCEKLNSLNLTNLYVNEDVNTNNMFKKCKKLLHLKTKDEFINNLYLDSLGS